ncbi:hypothetical protein [Paenibacillus sp. FSL H7-0918]|uniref:hypothetical protein n=1 Tax=Paenibacillus sp. FSL H7-0918 TaxID=2921442 RepID=UPI0030F8D96F
MFAHEIVLMLLFVKGPQETYSYYAKKGEVDHLILNLLDLNAQGYIYVNSGSWSWSEGPDVPGDLNPLGIKLTRIGELRAGRLVDVFKNR